MPTISRTIVWERWVPPLGEENEKAERPFFLEVASGLTKETLATIRAAFWASIQAAPEVAEGVDRWRAWADVQAGIFEKVARLGTEPLCIIDDATKEVAFEVKNLSDFFFLCLQGPKGVLLELARTVNAFNSLNGHLELFFARHSGSTGTTPAPSVAKVESPPVVR